MGSLSKLRKHAGISQAALARLAKTSQPQINRLEHDERKLTGEWAMRLAPHLGTIPEELIFGSRTVPIVGHVGAGSEAHYYAEADSFHGLAKFPPSGTEKTVAVQARGDSLGGAFDGWIIYYDDRRDPPTEDLLGTLCVVGLTSGQILVKMLMKGRVPGHFDLFSGASGSPLTDQSVQWAARVTALMPPWLALVEETQLPRPKARKKPKRRKK